MSNNSLPHDPSSEDEVLEREAAEWFFKKDRGLTLEEHAEWIRWLAVDPQHARLYAEIGGVWSDSLAVEHEIIPVERPETPSLGIRGRFRFLGIPVFAAAAALALAVVYFNWWRPIYYSEQAVTNSAENRNIALPDGSCVVLQSSSTISIAFSPRERRIRLLKGSAFFSVAKNPKRPFFVEANTITVRAVGTAFNVRIQADSVDVIVTEGTVKVAREAQTGSNRGLDGLSLSPPLYLNAGHRITLPLPSSTPASQPVAEQPGIDEKQRGSLEHRVDFTDAPLADIVAEFNRHNSKQFVIMDPKLAKLRLGGSFPPDDCESFARILATRFNVSVMENGDTIELRLIP